MKAEQCISFLIQWVKEILASKERVTPGPKLPAKGLTLIQIEYPEDRANAE